MSWFHFDLRHYKNGIFRERITQLQLCYRKSECANTLEISGWELRNENCDFRFWEFLSTHSQLNLYVVVAGRRGRTEPKCYENHHQQSRTNYQKSKTKLARHQFKFPNQHFHFPLIKINIILSFSWLNHLLLSLSSVNSLKWKFVQQSSNLKKKKLLQLRLMRKVYSTKKFTVQKLGFQSSNNFPQHKTSFSPVIWFSHNRRCELLKTTGAPLK